MWRIFPICQALSHLSRCSHHLPVRRVNSSLSSRLMVGPKDAWHAGPWQVGLHAWAPPSSPCCLLFTVSLTVIKPKIALLGHLHREMIHHRTETTDDGLGLVFLLLQYVLVVRAGTGRVELTAFLTLFVCTVVRQFSPLAPSWLAGRAHTWGKPRSQAVPEQWISETQH